MNGKNKGNQKNKYRQPQLEDCKEVCSTIMECDTDGCKPVETCWEDCSDKPVDV